MYKKLLCFLLAFCLGLVSWEIIRQFRASFLEINKTTVLESRNESEINSPIAANKQNQSISIRNENNQADYSKDEEIRSFNPSGYFITDESTKNSSNVRWILLSDYSKTQTVSPMVVELRIGNESRWKTFLQSTLKIKDYRISFKTKAMSGLTYEFQGQFYPNREERKTGFFDESMNQSTVLRGILKTMRGKKTVRSEKLNFYYTTGD
jgi:hypothetical protein